MNTCATCKWWDDLFQQHPTMEEGGCALTLAEGDGDEWMQPTHPTKAHAFIIFPNRGAPGDEFQRAILITQSDFGCVLWEGKD